jgi:transposase
VDPASGGRGDSPGVWRDIPSFPGKPHPENLWLESAEARTPGYPAKRGRHSALERGALASAQKKAIEEQRTIVWVDESGFYLLPGVASTWAPVGKTPILRSKLSREHFSAISAITLEGGLYLMMKEGSFKGPDVVQFLQGLLEEIPGKVMVIWDGAPIHRSKVVKGFLARGAAQRLHLEPLPAYAPELNPDEGIWRYLKRVELRNVCCQDLLDLLVEITMATKRLLNKPDVIRACLNEVGYV